MENNLTNNATDLTIETLKILFDLALAEYKSVQSEYEIVANEMKEAMNRASLLKRHNLDQSKALEEFHVALESFLKIEDKLNKARNLSRQTLQKLEEI
jgi:hypothetical protein